MASSIMKGIPESLETDRLLIRSVMPGDGAELNAAVTESLEELEPWMPWIRDHVTVKASGESARRARIAFIERSDLRMHLFLKGRRTHTTRREQRPAPDSLVGAEGRGRLLVPLPFR
jgi:hypothetical protein